MEVLKWLREEKEESQKDLADILKVSMSTVGKWETGTHEPNPEMLRKLAYHYDVSVDYLVGYTNIRQKHITIDDLLKEYMSRTFKRSYRDDEICMAKSMLEILEKYKG